nr:MAG TPA: hypothetical protein [Caudoviricetes sp.]
MQAAVDRNLIPTNPVDVTEAHHKFKPAHKELSKPPLCRKASTI